MKVLFILAYDVYLTPYLKFYTKILEEQNIDYEVVYWGKNENEIIKDPRYIRFNCITRNKLDKIWGYIKFRKFIKQLAKKKEYAIIVPLHAIVTMILYKWLTKKYRDRYIYDVRDYSFEKLVFYRRMQKGLVKYSILNIISSKGYEAFLPNAKYYVTHNIPYGDYKRYRQLEDKANNSVIQISYIGLIRFMEQNKKILLFFKNDRRFHLNFIGTNAKQLKGFCEENGIENVTLIDTFDSDKTLEFYKDTDLIMNLYGNHTPLLDYALSNKLYYSACLYKPILVCEDTYMEKVSKEYNIGFTLRLKEKTEKDFLYTYIIELDRQKLKKNCDRFMKDVYSDKDILENEIVRKLQEIKDKVKR